jgi:hypothetical protein
MKQIIRLTESDLHRLVKESVRRILAETDASSSGDVNRPVFPMMRRPSIVGKPINKKVDKLEDDASDREGGKNHSLSVNYVDESVNEGWKDWAVAGMMAMSPMQGNAQTQNYQQNDSIRTTAQQSQQMTIEQLMKLFPQAYKDRNANSQVWQQNQKLYVAEVNGKISLVGKIAASHGQNPWDALVKRYCPQEDNVFQLGDFDI